MGDLKKMAHFAHLPGVFQVDLSTEIEYTSQMLDFISHRKTLDAIWILTV